MLQNKDIPESIRKDNQKILKIASIFLDEAADAITPDDIAYVANCGVSLEYAYASLLASAFGLDIVDNADDIAFFETYMLPMVRQLKASDYRDDPYYRSIKVPSVKFGNCELTTQHYKPYEGFPADDLQMTAEGRIIPRIGFFTEPFSYPAVLEDGRIWMTLIPNELETMKKPIADAHGKVLSYGLGLGYYAYRVLEKDDVESLTIVECNETIISLLEKYLLPQFKHTDKLRIIHDDAYRYAAETMPKEHFDYVFTDLWHDVSDGLPLYQKMKQFEHACPQTEFAYWIERSMLCYV